MANDMKSLCVKTLFGEREYLIPVYRRNYAWGKQELTQLMQDVLDYSDKVQNYYIGSFVVYEKKSDSSVIYEIIDGQQRLTALTIILDVIKNEFKNEYDINNWYRAARLDFKSRKISTNLYKNSIIVHDDNVDYKKLLITMILFSKTAGFQKTHYGI